jgi:four helix bundle protein
MAKHFEDLDVWKIAFDLAHEVRTATKLKTFKGDGDMRSQMRRAAVSIPSNIAEGYEKGSARDSIKFYRIAKGSGGELRTQLKLCLRANEMPREEAERLIAGCYLVSRSLGGFIRHLEERGIGG